MTVLSRIIRKVKPKTKTLEEKIKSLDQLSTEELLAVAEGEGHEILLRDVAVSRLPYRPVLLTVAFTSVNPKLQLTAKKRIAELIESEEISFTQFCIDCTDIIKQLSVLGLCKEPSLLKKAIEDSTDQELLYQIALDGVSIKIRQLAAEKIDNSDQLKRLLKSTKSKDKVVYKIAKEKLLEAQRQIQRAEEVSVAIEALCQKIERHSKREYDKTFTATFDLLWQQWQEFVDIVEPEIKSRAESAAKSCKKIVSDHDEAQSLIKAKEQAVATAKLSQNKILADLKTLLRSVFAEENVESEGTIITEKLASLCTHWKETEELFTAKKTDAALFLSLVDGIKSLLECLKTYGSLSIQIERLRVFVISISDNEQAEAMSESQAGEINCQSLKDTLKFSSLLIEDLPVIVSEAQLQLSSCAKEITRRKTESKNQVRHVGGLIAKAKHSVAIGQSRQSAGIRRSIDQKLAELKTIPAFLETELAQLDESLEKLLDWKSFVVEPKKQQLIEQMVHLKENDDEPEVLAVKIKRLQDDWKGLSKGGHDHDQDLWDRFHQLAQEAYEPCKIYFGEKALVRQKNLEKRQELVKQLRQYIESFRWDSTAEQSKESINNEDQFVVDWGKVEKVLSTATIEWRSYSPSDRNATKTLQLEFDRHLNTIRAALNSEYEKNVASKRLLIEKALHSLELEDSRQATDEVKKLQGLWKKIGLTARRDDNRLWKEFRAACDTVFEKRKVQSELFKADLEENKNRMNSLNSEVNELANLKGQAILEVIDRVKTIQTEIRDIDQLPRAESNELRKRISQSIERFEAAVSAQRAALKNATWTNLLEAANKIRLFQLASFENADPESVTALRASAQTFVDSIERWPKGGHTAIEQKFASEHSATTIEENELALRMLCIRAEILCGQSSPQEDQAIRMAYQVKRLEKGLGQNNQEIKPALNSLLYDWISIGPVSTPRYETLLERMNNCRKII